jgi:C4-type Zn-finger protein
MEGAEEMSEEQAFYAACDTVSADAEKPTTNRRRMSMDCPHCKKELKLISVAVDHTKEEPVTTEKFRCMDCGFQRTEKS